MSDQFWIAVKGAYDEAEPLGVASSEESARDMLRQVGADPEDCWAGAVHGPFTLDKLIFCGPHGRLACFMGCPPDGTVPA